MKKLFIILASLFISISTYSQYSSGTFKFSLNLGNSPYTDYASSVNQKNESQTIQIGGVSQTTGNNNLVNMLGAEFRFFVAEKLAIKFLAGGQAIIIPAQNNIPGTADNYYSFDPLTDVPSFSDVKEQKIHQYTAIIGVDKYFVKNKVALYTGIEGGFRYGANSSKGITEESAGTAINEIYGFNGAITFGAEYNVDGGLFFGLEVRPVSFAYTVTTLEPIPGASQQADSYNVGFLVYPMMKVGINF